MLLVLSLSSACVLMAAGSLSDCWEKSRQTSPSSQLPTDKPSHNPSSFHQLAPVLAYALYLHEQRLIPDVILQLSRWISQASSQRDPHLMFCVDAGSGFLREKEMVIIHPASVRTLIPVLCGRQGFALTWPRLQMSAESTELCWWSDKTLACWGISCLFSG